MDQPVIIPMLSIHPSKINVYSQVEWSGNKHKSERFKNFGGSSNDHKNKVSVHAKRKINKAIEYLVFLSTAKKLPSSKHGKNYQFRVSFVTLTLPSCQVHSDKEIKEKCLNQFLVEARKKWKVRNYIWRAEKQKNGNIHFHVLCDKFIPWSELRDVWNRIVNKLDYVSRYRDQMRDFHSGGFKVREDLLKKWEYKKQIKAYRSGKANDWHNPNSTDIHSIKHVNDIVSYMSKYYTKDEQTVGISGRLWGCNTELSNVPGAKLIIDYEINEALTKLCHKNKPRIYEGEYFQSISITLDMLKQPDSEPLFQAFGSFIYEHFGVPLQKHLA